MGASWAAPAGLFSSMSGLAAAAPAPLLHCMLARGGQVLRDLVDHVAAREFSWQALDV
eukprot:CAMPEP_0119060364 /NCGR_PEP_ID=MMETSP1178-20130426/4335_1 /TAXON_ID=33656 /ORGANISM="unid sp, Strain CCMP2000" /LENGTH=57 /DNA_ID=CAMNT_0007041461 /DNA_START=126 /DNA_END=297 /DNA_ORIENTATION=+